MDGRGRRTEPLARVVERRVASAFGVPVRYTTRTALRLWKGQIVPPRRIGLALAAALLGTTAVYGAAASGRAGTWTDAMLGTAGFAVTDVELVGAHETSEAAVVEAIGLGRASSIAGIDLAAAHAALTALPWVAQARVSKAYPASLRVEIVEREAAARWMLGARTFLVDLDGTPIIESDGRPLPLLVGQGADEYVDAALALRAAAPDITPQIKALVRVAARRWDVVTHRNVIVMLPDDDPTSALRTLSALHDAQGLLDKEVAAIDLRVRGQLTVRLTDTAAAQRSADVMEAAKTLDADRKTREVAL